MYYKNRLFTEIVLNEFVSRFLSFSKSLVERFSDFLGLENRFENRGIFSDVTDPEFWIWRGGSTSDLGLLKR